MTATGPAVTLQVREDDTVLEPYRGGWYQCSPPMT
jgi:hypothetical protein